MFDIVRFKGDLERLLNRYIAGGPVEDYREMADFLRDVGDQIDHRRRDQGRPADGRQDRRGGQVPETDAATAVTEPSSVADGLTMRDHHTEASSAS